METAPPRSAGGKGVLLWVVGFVVVALGLVAVIYILTKSSATIEIVAKNDKKNVTVNITVPSADSADIAAAVTTTKFRFSQVFYPTGNKTTDSIAGGTVTLYNKTSAPINLIKTTRVLSSSNVLFRLVDKVTIPANGQIDAQVYADQPGKSGEIGPSDFTIPGLPTDKQAVIYAKSTATMQGGVVSNAILTQKDIDDAKKMYVQKASEAFLASFASSSVKQAAFAYAQTVTADKKPGDQITSFTLSGDNNFVVVTYDEQAVLTAVQKKLRSMIDLSSEKIVSADSAPQVIVGSYTPTTGEVSLAITESVVVTIDPNADKLAPSNFFGESKDQIERYLLGLDHVERATVSLSPSWMNSAPKSPDRIKVIVKDM